MDEWNKGRPTNVEQAVGVILRKALFRLHDKPHENTFVFIATASPTCSYIMLVCFYSVIIYDCNVRNTAPVKPIVCIDRCMWLKISAFILVQQESEWLIDSKT